MGNEKVKVSRSIDSCLSAIGNMVADNKYKGTNSKSPKIKRNARAALDFWESIQSHLTDLKQLKNGK